MQTFARWSCVASSLRRVCVVVGTLSCVACSNPASPPAEANPLIEAAALELYAALPPQRPGFGITDYPGHAEGDVPKSYAMVLLAELERLGSDWRGHQDNLARAAGRWLLEHADSNADGVIGWGLPVAWDAYEDGSVNAPHTEYTIATAIVLDALLTWAEQDLHAPADLIRRTVTAAIAPYLNPAQRSPSGMAPYSLTVADRRYDTFNPAAYLAGQIQRASLQVTDRRLRAQYSATADATMRALLQHRRVAAGTGHWYWNYSVQQALPNDLPHAGYVVAGIRAYIEHGGRLGDEFDWYAVLGHLNDFRGEAGRVRAFPTFVTGLKMAARSYDLGFALHLACTESAIEGLVPAWLEALPRYRAEQGRYLKHPSGTSSTALVINEYEAYLYRGLTSCAMRWRERAHAARATQAALPLRAYADTGALADRLLAQPPSTPPASKGSQGAPTMSTSGVPVPLLPAEAGHVSFDRARRATLSLPEGAEITLPVAGVPVRVLATPASTLVFLRRHPGDELLLLRYAGNRLACTLAVDAPFASTHKATAAMPALRAATLRAGRLHAVVYDNVEQANAYLAWDVPVVGCPLLQPPSPTARLPSLEEPAGSTYEMVPSLHFHADANRLWLAGGNMQLEVGSQGPGAVERIAGCRHIVESAPTPTGLAHLCVASSPAGVSPERPLIVVAPPGVESPMPDAARGVPNRIAWSNGALRLDHASSPAQLRRLLRRDLERTAPGGWMELGINNTEGRVPWSQVYYLDGLLDIAMLARRDARLLAVYGPLLPELRRRLDLEMDWLDEHISAGRHRTRAFTIDRSPALFAVQTSRMLMLMHRYRLDVPEARQPASYETLRHAVHGLHGHIDVLASEGEEERWIAAGRRHLRWPRGSAFQFDGMPVPFNHQNEWAHAVLATADSQTPAETRSAAQDVVAHFMDRIAPEGSLPTSGTWDYWWGRAYDGWGAADRYSINTPRFRGDRIKAWISFRTIDALALLEGTAHAGGRAAGQSVASVADLAERGLLYPFVNRGLVMAAGKDASGGTLHVSRAAATAYSRVSSPWELANASWCLARFALEGRGDVRPSGR